jgi:hypothetical protein
MANQYQKTQHQLDNMYQNVDSIFEYVHFKPLPTASSSVDNLGYYSQNIAENKSALPMTRLPGLYTKKSCEFNAALSVNNSYANSTKAYYALVDHNNRFAPVNTFSCYVATTEKTPGFESALQNGSTNRGITIWECINTQNANESRLLDSKNYALLSQNGDFSIYNGSDQKMKTLVVGKDILDASGNIIQTNNITVSLENDGILYWNHPVLGKKIISKTNTDVVSQLDPPMNTNVIWQTEMSTNGYKSVLASIPADGSQNKLAYQSNPIISDNGVYRLEVDYLGNLVIRMYIEKPFRKTIENGDIAYYTKGEEDGRGKDFYPYSVSIDPKMDKTFLSMNYPGKDGKLIQSMRYVSPDHPDFKPSTNYDIIENVYSNTEALDGKVFTSSEVSASCKKMCDASANCKSYNIVSSKNPLFKDLNLCLLRNKKVDNMIPIDSSSPGMNFTSNLYIKKNEPVFMKDDVRKSIPFRSSADYVSYNNFNLDMNPYATGLGKYYDDLVKERNLLYQGKEGLSNMDSTSNLEYVTTQQFYQTHGASSSQNNVKDAIQKRQIEPSIQNTIAYESKLYTINSNYNSLGNSIQTITNKNGTGVRDVMMKDSKYDFSGNDFRYAHPISTKTDGLLEDIRTMTMYENSIYILGAITSATLLVGAIVMSNE